MLVTLDTLTFSGADGDSVIQQTLLIELQEVFVLWLLLSNYLTSGMQTTYYGVSNGLTGPCIACAWLFTCRLA